MGTTVYTVAYAKCLVNIKWSYEQLKHMMCYSLINEKSFSFSNEAMLLY